MADEIDRSRAHLRSEEQVALLRSGVERWNAWRQEHPEITRLDLRFVNMSGRNLREANLRGVRLSSAILSDVDLYRAGMCGASLDGALLTEADLREADLTEADLSGANFMGANFMGADLTGANLSRENLTGADLTRAILINTSLANATLDGCNVFGVSVWKVRLDGATQTNLRITDFYEPAITVDDLRVAQFLHLILNNQEIRAVLDTIASKVVLILGRFSAERKPALDSLRAALREHPNGYISVVFDFEPQAEKPILETVKTLANLARFVVVDLTDPNMVRSELTAITTSVPSVPIRPLIESESPLPTEVTAWAVHRSFLPIYRYRDISQLLAALDEAVITPAEQFVRPRPIVERPSS